MEPTNETTTNENLTPISADDLAKQQQQQEEVTEKQGEVVDEQTPPLSDEGTKDATEVAEENAETVEPDVDEVPADVEETSGEASKEEEEKNNEKDKVEEQEETKEDVKEPETNAEVEELKKQIEEFQFEKEEQEGVRELQGKVQEAQTTFADFEARVNAALRDALTDNKIDLNKTLEEIRKDDPAQFKVAMDLINQAEAVKQRQIEIISRQIEDVQNKLIFKRAEREFNKFELNDEEAKIAADTFINIMRQVGINDLKDDLKAKVSLAVGQGKLLAKTVKEKATKVAEVAEKVKQGAEVIEQALAKKEEAVTKEPEKVEVTEETDKVTTDEVVETVADEVKEEALEEAKDDPVNPAVDAGAPAKVDDPDVLTKLAQFKQGSKEQLAFYKEHYGEINRAMQRFHRGV